jgi:hypothetical protein
MLIQMMSLSNEHLALSLVINDLLKVLAANPEDAKETPVTIIKILLLLSATMLK